MSSTVDPFVAPPPAEVPLEHAPLVRVIAQVRFPENLEVEQRDFVARFQRTVKATYPVLRQDQMQGWVVTPSGIEPTRPQVAWRFGDVDGHWRVSLTARFLTLETTKYNSRSDFFGRFRAVVEALHQHVEPKLVDRLGVRYIDRITGTAVDEIGSLVRDEVLGIIRTPASEHATLALSECIFERPDAQVHARWGRLPPGATVDPAAIEPAEEKSWILDLDMFSVGSMPFGVDEVVANAQQYAARIYTIFRWAVTDEFLRRYGGTP
jgi:uncharacterized protein (TIGR04255 family)